MKMEITTYNLNINNDYYNIINKLTDVILNKAQEYFDRTLINEYINNEPEKLLEILLLGTYWDCYISNALSLENNAKKVLIKINSMRENYPNIKEDIDYLKGYISTMFLYQKEIKSADLSLDSLDKLIEWLTSCGEYNEEIYHISKIRTFLKDKTQDEIKNIISDILCFTDFFNKESKLVLDKYTSNLNIYLKNKINDHINKEDIIFCSQVSKLYYINMVGAEIMNRTYKEEYLKRPRKIVLIPRCMCLKQNENCKAKKDNLGYICNNCSKNCNANLLTKKGKSEGFEVYIIPHESVIFNNITKKDQEEIGIIGISCIINLISGGWKSDRLGIPAQCVLINQVGCSHWLDKPQTTNIDITKLEDILKT